LKSLALYFFVLFIYGCSAATDYYQVIPPGSDGMAVKPDKFKVDSSRHPIFHVSNSLTPPDGETYWISGAEYVPMTSILPSDTWKVTHIYRDLFIVQSEEYNDRQCRYLDEINRNPAGGGVNIFGSCLQAFEYGIYLNEQGEIAGGWELLPGEQKIFSARKMFLAPNDEKTEAWPRRTVFEKD